MVTYSPSLSETQRPSRKEEIVLIKRSQSGDLQARNRLIVSHLWTVYPIAKRYAISAGDRTTYEELREEGQLGLFDAVDGFDSSKGARLSTYARIRITRKIKEFLYRNSLVQVPVYLSKIHQKVLCVEERHLSEHMRKPTLEEIVHALSFMSDPSRSNTIIGNNALNLTLRSMQASKRLISLDESPPADKPREETRTYHDIVTDDRIAPIVDDASNQEIKSDINYLLMLLPDRERFILKHIYGLDSAEVFTFKELGEKLGMTGEGVRQIQNKVLKRLRLNMEKRDK